MNKKALSIIMACVLSVGVMVGCTSNDTKNDKTNNTTNKTNQNTSNANNQKKEENLQNKVDEEKVFDEKEEAILSKKYVDLTEEEKTMFDKINEKYQALKEDVKATYKSSIERLTKEKEEFMKKK